MRGEQYQWPAYHSAVTTVKSTTWLRLNIPLVGIQSVFRFLKPVAQV